MPENYIDFKVTTWIRIAVKNQDVLDRIIQKFKDEEIINPCELYSDSDFKLDEDIMTSEEIHDVSEWITPEENDLCSTIEIYTDTDKGYLLEVWNNSRTDSKVDISKDQWGSST